MAEVSLLLAYISRERLKKKGRQSSPGAVPRGGSALLFLIISWTDSEAALQCHYSSTQAPGSRSLLTWHSDIIVEPALGAKGWLGTLLTAKRQTHPGEARGD